jgi:membrane protease YdiL (CAAX protease family)
MKAAHGPSTGASHSTLAASAWIVLGALVLSLSGEAFLQGVSVQRLWVLLLISPVIEEAAFRAGLQESLMRRWPGKAMVANVVTALAFAAAHIALRGDARAIAVVLPALLLGDVYRRWHRLGYCIGLHVAMNAVWLAIGLAQLGPAAPRTVF